MPLWGKTDQADNKPTYLTSTEKSATVGISVGEATTAANKAKGLNTPGWVKYSTYTDAQGNTRHKSEVLVAFSTLSGDADDDSIAVDPVITITAQPQDASVDAGDAVTFSVTATSTSTGDLSYQWQKQVDGAGAWANVTGATEFEYTIDETAAGDDDDKYRVVVSAAGAADVTSDAATLVVA